MREPGKVSCMQSLDLGHTQGKVVGDPGSLLRMCTFLSLQNHQMQETVLTFSSLAGVFRVLPVTFAGTLSRTSSQTSAGRREGQALSR